jgi:hypothetical protein
MKNETSVLVADLHRRIDAIVAAAKKSGHDEALGHIRALVVGGGIVKRGPGRPRKNPLAAAISKGPKKRRKNSWAGLSPAARLARINAIRKGKGLPPRDA